MPKIKLITVIRAPVEVCFDLSRSIDLHLISTKHTGEQAISGVTTGLIGLHEMVTWRAKHFGIWQTLSTKITEFQRPVYFVDEMIKGAFKSFRHEHHFKRGGLQTTTTMVDFFNYQSPFGLIGKAVDSLILIDYMTRLLQKRNQVIKECAESGSWKTILK